MANRRLNGAAQRTPADASPFGSAASGAALWTPPGKCGKDSIAPGALAGGSLLSTGWVPINGIGTWRVATARCLDGAGAGGAGGAGGDRGRGSRAAKGM